jgi:glutaconate CoA-transferase subunit A
MNKVVSPAEAVALISDGDVVALQNMATQACPMVMVREIIRAGRHDLTMVCLVGGMAVDWLACAGAMTRFIGAAVSMEQFGLCQQYRKAVEEGRIRVEELSETALNHRLGAGARGLPFMVTKGLIGTDLIDLQPENLRLIDDPFGGPPVVACRALVPDVALIHAHRCDRSGNVAYEPTAMWPDIGIFPKAARRVIVTAEEIVEEEVLRLNPDRTILPGFTVDAVVHAPYGAHPTSFFPRYGYDGAFHRAWTAVSRDDAEAKGFLDRCVHAPRNHAEYLDAAGGVEMLMRIGRWG